MTDEVQLGNPWALPLILLAVPVVLMLIWSAWRRLSLQRRWASPQVLSRLLPTRPLFRDALSAVCLVAVVILLAIALADIRWGKVQQEVPQRGIEVVFLLDVSRSMLAEDVTPNRLERAKQQIREMLGEMAGDRVALIAFAGETKQVVPLTNHYDSFDQQLDEVSISTVRRGGSKLGDALQVAADAFLSKTNAYKAIVVFTDGEDQASDPVEVAEQLNADHGIRIYTVGLGDMDQGARIPDADPDRPDQQPGRFVKHEGQAVWSKMNGAILSEVAINSQGVYIPAGTRRVDMADLYRRTIAKLPQSEFDRVKIDAYAVRFGWFALPAFLLLLFEALLTTGILENWRASSKRISAWFVFGLLLSNAGAAHAETTNDRDWVVSGNESYRQSRFAEAIERYEQAAASSNDQLARAARYNLGTTHYRLALAASTKSETAGEALARANESIKYLRLALRLDPAFTDARYNLQRALQLRDQLQQQENEQQQQRDQREQQQDEQPADQQQQPNEQNQSSNSQNANQEQNQSENSDPSPNSEQSDPSDSKQPSEQNADDPQSGQPQEQPSQSQDSSAGSDTKQSQNGEGSDEPESNQPVEESDQDNPQNQDPTGQLDADEMADGDTAPNGQTRARDSAETAESEQTMSRQEAMKMLQAVRDRDLIRRYRQQMQDRSRHIPVEKDW